MNYARDQRCDQDRRPADRAVARQWHLSRRLATLTQAIETPAHAHDSQHKPQRHPTRGPVSEQQAPQIFNTRHRLDLLDRHAPPSTERVGIDDHAV